MGFEKDFLSKEGFKIHACFSAYFLQRTSAFADKNSLLRISFYKNGGTDAEYLFLIFKIFDTNFRAVRNFLLIVLEYFFTDDF